MRNVDAVHALVRACVQTPSIPLQERIIDVLVTLLTTNANNYFILQEHDVLLPLVEQLDMLPLPIVVRQVSSKATQPSGAHAHVGVACMPRSGARSGARWRCFSWWLWACSKTCLARWPPSPACCRVSAQRATSAPGC